MDAGNTPPADTLVVIPARRGSKGLPDKNIRPLCGKPLLAYSIEAALCVPEVARVFVSTEDEQIAEVARAYGAEVPFFRPAELAQDHSCIGDAVDHAVGAYEAMGLRYDKVVTLFPTHPFRSAGLMRLLVSKLSRHPGVYTVKRVDLGPRQPLLAQTAQGLAPVLGPEAFHAHLDRRPYYRRYGTFLGTSKALGAQPYVHVLQDPIELIDIDYLEDFRLAEMVIREGLYRFGGEEARCM